MCIRDRAADVGGQLRPLLAPKAEELYYSVPQVLDGDNLRPPGAMAEDASGPAAREASGPPAPGARPRKSKLALLRPI
eukprot:5300078-Alexandrium_andersonii.AAC.1